MIPNYWLMRRIIRPFKVLKIWEQFYNEAIVEGDMYPEDSAWMKLNEYFRRGDNGEFQLVVREDKSV